MNYMQSLYKYILYSSLMAIFPKLLKIWRYAGAASGYVFLHKHRYVYIHIHGNLRPLGNNVILQNPA